VAELFVIDRIPLAGSQWRYGEKFIVTQDLEQESYIVDGYDGNKFDLSAFCASIRAILLSLSLVNIS